MSSWELPSYSRRQEPIAYVRGIALDLTTILVIAHVVTALLSTVALAMGFREQCYSLFIFDTETFWQGRFWTPLTDPFFHDLAREHIWFVIGLAMFWWFGRDLELYLGRAKFALLYVLLILVPVLVDLIAAKILGTTLMIRVPYLGVPAHFGIFIAFCVVYPGLVFWPGIAAKWLALAYTGISVMAILAIPHPLSLIPFFSCLGTAWGFMHFCGANRLFDPFEWVENWKQDRALKKFEERQKKIAEDEEDFNEAVNPILDKIAREGIQSLTSHEKQKLEKARSRLLQQEKNKPK